MIKGDQGMKKCIEAGFFIHAMCGEGGVVC
jgi:hypothetical protein